MERYKESSDYVKDHFMKIFNQKAFQQTIGFKFIDDNKQKQVIKVQKLSDMYKYLVEKDILIIINEELFDKMDQEIINILIEQEIDRIEVNFESGKIKINSPEIVTSAGTINKYGTEAVMRANQVEVLLNDQNEDVLSF